MTHCSVVAFNIGFLLRIAWLDVIQPDSSYCSGQFASVTLMCSGPFSLRMDAGLPPSLNDLTQRAFDPICRQRKSIPIARVLPVNVTNHIEQPALGLPDPAYLRMAIP
ncbi:MAG: hypothetical protein KGQ58_06185 [Proteobacteria bacterium]|nr:hypothetical protein [Pseudomonadota bacterium]